MSANRHDCHSWWFSVCVRGLNRFFLYAWGQYASSSEIVKKGFSTECKAACANTTFTWLWCSFYTDVENMASADCKQHVTLHTSCWHMAHFLLHIYFFFPQGRKPQRRRGGRGATSVSCTSWNQGNHLLPQVAANNVVLTIKYNFWTTSSCLEVKTGNIKATSLGCCIQK